MKEVVFKAIILHKDEDEDEDDDDSTPLRWEVCNILCRNLYSNSLQYAAAPQYTFCSHGFHGSALGQAS